MTDEEIEVLFGPRPDACKLCGEEGSVNLSITGNWSCKSCADLDATRWGFGDLLRKEAEASVALDNDSRIGTCIGKECPHCHRVSNIDNAHCDWCKKEISID